MALITTLAQNLLPSLRTRQPSVSYLPLVARRLQRARRNLERTILIGIEPRKMLPDHLLAGVALDALGAGIPVHDVARGIEHVDRVVGHALDQQAEAPLGLA